MNKMIEEVRNRLEREKSNSKRFLLSNLYITLYDFLNEEEKNYENKFLNQIDLILSDYEFYDFLRNDAEIFRDFSLKTCDRYKKAGFNFYDLYPKNKIKFDEAKEIIFDILNDMGLDNIDKIYDFDKIKYRNLENCEGVCINPFGFFDGNIVLDEKISKMVVFIKALSHEIGHNYENLFMSNMSSIQQIKRYVYCFIEVCSSFFERIALDYLIKNRIYLDDANRDLNCYYCDLYDRLSFLGDVTSKDDLEDAIYDEENILCVSNNFNKETEDGENVVLYEYNYANDIKYGYGALLGEYFFDIYKKDKKEGLKSIKNFLSNQGLLDERGMLDSINFSENDFSFFDDGLLENAKYMRKRYKW